MDIMITGRHTEISDRFREQVAEKLEKITQLCPSAYRIDVEVSHERNPRQAATCKKVEITVHDKGPVIRAEAVADEPYSAFDLAFGKLLERLRRSRDRRKVHHGRHTPASVRRGTELAPGTLTPASLVSEAPSNAGSEGADDGAAPPDGDAQTALVIRAKDHDAVPMTVDQALYEMELVGHDFFLFLDSGSGLPSVVYRRRGWNYGVIRLRTDSDLPDSDAPDGATEASVDDAAPDERVDADFDGVPAAQNGSANDLAHTIDGLVSAHS